MFRQFLSYCHVYYRLKTGFGLVIGCINTLYDHYSAIADLHYFLFTVTHALEFSVFTSRLLVTELKVSL
jgi:hypothetical protein